MLEPRAELTGDVYEPMDGEGRDSILFLLKDCSHSFTIGLSDVLECLKFAEEKGEVPELPEDWRSKVEYYYPELREPVDVPDEEDEEI